MTMSMNIIALLSVLIWGAVIHELNKPSKRQSSRKIIAFTFLGALTTAVITVSLFQHLLV